MTEESSGPLPVVAIVGRPNVGKSTLVNAMVGRKVAIVSDKPQTTRRAIRGVVTVPDQFQLVLTDLPGVQRPRDELTRRMQHRVEQELGEADAALFVVNADQGVGGPGDQWIAEADAVVVEGRDIGTVVLPDATLKIYLTASPEVRAQRRAGQLGVTDPQKIAALAKDMRRRDDYDSRRADSPLRPAEDAVVVDSTDLDKGAVVERIVELARSAVAAGDLS